MATISKVGKKWKYRIQKKKNGKIIFDYTQSGFLTKAQAQIHAKQKEVELFQGKTIIDSNITFAAYFDEWVHLYKIDGTSRSDLFRRSAIKKAYALFGDLLLKDMTSKQYQQLISNFATTLSQSTIKKYHHYFKACLENAVDEQFIKVNPAKKAVIRGNAKNIKPIEDKYLNYEDAIKLKQAILDDQYSVDKISRNMIVIALETGMRFGEILALTWDRIDFNANTIRIDRSWDYHMNHCFIPTKTKNSRTITLSNDCITFLKHIKENTASQFAYGSDVKITNNGVNHSLAKACKRANIKIITMHALRHTHGSILLYKGFNISYISKRLGHATVSITQDVYLHILEELQRQEDTKILSGIL